MRGLRRVLAQVVHDSGAAMCRRSSKSRPPLHDGGMITVQDWAEIRHLDLSEGMSRRAIDKHLKLSRVTVIRAMPYRGSDGRCFSVWASTPGKFTPLLEISNGDVLR